jgi:pimeloyl-ACP methyl ester carboxylesterase
MANAPGNGVVEAAPQYSGLSINGTKLAYRDTGRGEPMALIHANISDMRSWDPIESKLAERFRVIAYSRRYAWPNEPIAQVTDDPWAVHADDLAALIEKLAIAPVHALGNSTGAFVALLLARHRPELFRTLILEEPPVLSLFLLDTPPSLGQVLWFLVSHSWSFLPVVIYGATVIGPTTAAFKQGDDEMALQTFGRGALGSEVYARLSSARVAQMRTNVKPQRALLLGSRLPRFLEADASSIGVKTLIAMGAKKTGAHWHFTKRLAALIPEAKEVVIPDASHLIHEDNPSAVCEAILRFV